MKKFALLFSAAAMLTAFTTISSWKSDKVHSKFGFAVTHLGISEFSGRFDNFEVTVKSSKPDFSDASFEMTADVNSIDTDNEMRDKHLKTADFFDAEKFPTLSFKSRSIKPAGKNKYKLTGDLTMHGVTKPVVLDVLYRGTTVHPQSKASVAGFQVTGSIKRSDFGIATDLPVAMLSDVVRLVADGEFAKQ